MWRRRHDAGAMSSNLSWHLTRQPCEQTTWCLTWSSPSVWEIRDKQWADSCLQEVIAQIESGGKLPLTVSKKTLIITFLLREWNRPEMHNKVSYRKHQDNGRITYTLVLPEELWTIVLHSLHNDMGHQGFDCTLDSVQTKFFWPKVERRVKTCDRCIRRKAKPEKAAPLVT